MSNEQPETERDSDTVNQTHTRSDQRRVIRERYSDLATHSTSCCDTSDSCTCDSESDAEDGGSRDRSRLLGYSEDDFGDVSPAAYLGLGCGNPTGIASLRPGEVVLDLGAGAGFDCFLASQEVGASGRVIGVDMTPAMIDRARDNITRNDAKNVEFRLGEIEHLPVADASIDVILSNCVINLSPAKQRVFNEAYRVLRPGGRLAISDVVSRVDDIPPAIRSDPGAVSGCVGGASSISEIESILVAAGFSHISIEPVTESDEFIQDWDEDIDLSDYLVSATIEGRKPSGEPHKS